MGAEAPVRAPVVSFHMCMCVCVHVYVHMDALYRGWAWHEEPSLTETWLNKGLLSSDCLPSQLVLESLYPPGIKAVLSSGLLPLNYLLKPPHQTPHYLEPSQIMLLSLS